jgi:hypothetical protein
MNAWLSGKGSQKQPLSWHKENGHDYLVTMNFVFTSRRVIFWESVKDSLKLIFL